MCFLTGPSGEIGSWMTSAKPQPPWTDYERSLTAAPATLALAKP
jgi:hypothetical protein